MANLLTSLMLGGLVLLGGSPSPAPPVATSLLPGAVTEAAAVMVAPAPAEAPIVEAPVAAEAPSMRASVVNVLTEVGMVYVPRTFRPRADGAFDLVVHFHGTPGAVEGALDRAGIDAVLVVVNLGLGSGPYETRYQHESALDAVVTIAERTLVRAHVMAAPHVAKIALSSWSAGYGAVWRLLMRDKVAARVDAVLLADGMHSAFKPVGRREVEEAHMAPFVRFATLAASGDRMMAVTHSGIVTYKYASTTETAAYLERAVDMPPVATTEVGARGMKKTSHAEKGGLSIDGYAGNTPEAHCDHLLALADTTFGALGRRWARLRLT